MIKVVLSKNEELVSEIRAGLKNNDGYCPCASVKTPETKCMCKNFRDQIEAGRTGECHCGLYEIIDTEGNVCLD